MSGKWSPFIRALMWGLALTSQACGSIGGDGGPVLDEENTIHYRAIVHTSQYNVPAVVATAILSNVWSLNPERWYDLPDVPRFLGDSRPCEVQFTRYEDRTTDVFLYEDSLFPVIHPNGYLTSEATGLVSFFDNDPEDPFEVGDKFVRVFVLPRLATRDALNQVVPNEYLGLANSLPSQQGFASIFLSSSPISYRDRFSTFTHEMAHMLAPSPDWTDNATEFTNILTYPGELRWEWDAQAGTMVHRAATDLSVRIIVNVSGQSQCDAAWNKSHVRVISLSP